VVTAEPAAGWLFAQHFFTAGDAGDAWQAPPSLIIRVNAGP